MNKLLIVGLVLLVGCAAPINKKNAEKYHELGTQAEQKGDFKLAKQNYSRALINAKMGNSPKSGISMVTYNLERVTGYLCDYAESEKLLLESLRLEEEATGPDSGPSSMRIFELARLNYDQGLFHKAAPYYSRGISIVEKLDIESSDPIGFSNVLAEYAKAQREIHKIEQASLIEKRIIEIRNHNKGKQASFKPTRYNTNC